MTIKEKLIKEGKYNQILKIVEDIKEEMSSNEKYHIGYHYDDNGNLIQFVRKMDIADGANLWKYAISVDGVDRNASEMLDPFYWYIDRELHMKLHNYANSLVRGYSPLEKIEDIKPWSDLWDSINEIIYY